MTTKKNYGPWTWIKDRRPPEYQTVLFECVYENGNSIQALGYRNGRKYEIEWTNDHPQTEDIMFWMPFPDGPLGEMRADSTRARQRHARGLRP